MASSAWLWHRSRWLAGSATANFHSRDKCAVRHEYFCRRVSWRCVFMSMDPVRWVYCNSRQTRDVEPALAYCRAIVADAASISGQRRLNVSYLFGKCILLPCRDCLLTVYFSCYHLILFGFVLDDKRKTKETVYFSNKQLLFFSIVWAAIANSSICSLYQWRVAAVCRLLWT